MPKRYCSFAFMTVDNLLFQMQQTHAAEMVQLRQDAEAQISAVRQQNQELKEALQELDAGTCAQMRLLQEEADEWRQQYEDLEKEKESAAQEKELKRTVNSAAWTSDVDQVEKRVASLSKFMQVNSSSTIQLSQQR
jgi:polyhydroxyalkanoate synthesis regulator phasin